MSVKIIIAGSRNFKNKEFVFNKITEVLSNIQKDDNDIEIVSGCARGVDTYAIEYAVAYNISLKKFPADWSIGKSAGILRNIEMVDYLKSSDCKKVLIAFWDGESRGTNHTIGLCKNNNFNVYVFNE